MQRYYDKKTHTEVWYPSATTISLGDGVIDWWFEPLPDGYRVTYDSDGMPHKEKIPDPVPPDPVELKKQKIRDEMNALIGDMTPAESMLLMLKYGFEKMQSDNGSSDTPTPTIPLTPTGEDIITWGDRVAGELEDKLIELRSL